MAGMSYQKAIRDGITAKELASLTKGGESAFTYGPGGGGDTWNAATNKWVKAGSSGGGAPAPTAAPALSGLGGAAPVPAAPMAGTGGPTPPTAAGGDEGEGGGGMLGMLGMGGPPQQQESFEPALGPGLRSGLGQRAYPVRNPALAGLRKIY